MSSTIRHDGLPIRCHHFQEQINTHENAWKMLCNEGMTTNESVVCAGRSERTMEVAAEGEAELAESRTGRTRMERRFIRCRTLPPDVPRPVQADKQRPR